MITEALISFLDVAVATMIGWIPDLPLGLGNALADIPGYISTSIGWLEPFLPVLPVGHMATAVAVLFSGIVTALSIQLVRMIISHVTGGGGAT